MGKENKGHNKEADKTEEENSKANAKPQKAKPKTEESPDALLAQIRPKKRSIFFVVWVLAGAWILFIYDPCKIPGKDRKDCGYPDITPAECRSFACFTKGGGSALSKKTVKVKRKEGTTLGLDVDTSGKAAVVTSIVSGAVKEHNEELAADSEELIQVGDRVAKIDGKGTDAMAKVLKATGGKAVTVDILRPKLPSFLMWVSSGQTSKPNWAEKILTANGFKQWSVAFSYFGGAGMMCWLLSGYPIASLPIYYLGASGVLAFGTMRCCHDDGVSGGVPHCYKPRYTKFVEDIVPKIKEETVKFVGKIQKDPKAWFKKTFMA